MLNVETVRPLIAALSERHRNVLMLRFFENMTQTQIAERIGCSQMHVSRLIAQALPHCEIRSVILTSLRRPDASSVAADRNITATKRFG